MAAITAAAAATLIQYLHGTLDSQNLIVLLGLFLVTMVAPYLRPQVIMAFWRFNLQLGVAIAMVLVALVVVCGGLSLLLACLTFLFNIGFGRSYGHIWTTGAVLFVPLFAATMVPEDLDQRFTLSAEPDLIESAVSTVLNLALVPLILIYSAVLHVYAVKIAIYRSLPKGEIGWMVLAFGAIGTVSYIGRVPVARGGLSSTAMVHPFVVLADDRTHDNAAERSASAYQCVWSHTGALLPGAVRAMVGGAGGVSRSGA